MGEIFRLVATIKTNAKTAIGELKAVEKTGKTMGARLGKTMKTLAKVMKIAFVVGAAAATYALGKFFVSSIKSAAAFEQGMAMVQAVTGATGEEFDLLSEKAEELGRVTKFTMVEISEGMEALGRAGFTANEIIDSMAGVSDLAASQMIELGRAAEMTAGAINGFGLEADQAGRVADVYAYAASKSAINTEDLAETFKYVMPAANALGYSIEEVAGMAMEMGDSMIKGSMAGTSLSFAFSELVGMSDEFVRKLEDVGISVADISGPDGELLSMAEILGVMREKGLDAGDMFEIFGKRAGKGMAVLLQKGEDALNDYTDALEECGGTAQRMAEIQLDTLSGQVEVLRGSWELLKVTIGEKIIPLLKNFVKNTLIPLVNKLVSWAKENKSLEKSFKKFFDGVKTGFKWIIDNRTKIVTALKTIGVALAAIVAIKVTTSILNLIGGLTALLNPLVLAAAGLAALGYAFSELSFAMKSGLEKGQLAFQEWDEMSTESLRDLDNVFGLVTMNTLENIRKQEEARKEAAEAEKRLAFEQEMIRRGVIVVDQEVTESQKEELDEREEDYGNHVTWMVKKAVEWLKEEYEELSKGWDRIIEDFKDFCSDAKDLLTSHLGKTLIAWSNMRKENEEAAKEHGETMNDIVQDYADRRVEIDEDRAGKLKDINEEEAESLEDLRDDYEDNLNDIQDISEEMADLQGNRLESLLDQQQSYADSIIDLQRDLQYARLDDEERFQEESEDANTDYNRSIEDENTRYGRRLADLEEDIAKASGDRLVSLLDRKRELEETHEENLADIELKKTRNLEDIQKKATRAEQDRVQKEQQQREELKRRHNERLQEIEQRFADRVATLYEERDAKLEEAEKDFQERRTEIVDDARKDREKIEEDYNTALTDLATERERLLREEVEAYEEQRKDIWDILKHGVRDFLSALKEKFLLKAAAEAVDAAILEALALALLLPAPLLAAKYALEGLAHGVASAAYGVAGFGLAIAGFAKGALALGPTLGMIGEGAYNEAVIPLSPPVLADIGRGAVAEYAEVAEGGLRGSQSIEVNVAEGATFYVREEADVERIARELGEEFADRADSLGWTTA